MIDMARARVITALMLTVAISLIITVLVTTGQQPTLYRFWTYSPIEGVSEEYQVYRVSANGINYSRIVINIESVSGASLSNASMTVYALTPYHIVPVGVYIGSRIVISMNTPSIAYAVNKWVSWMLRSTWHSIQPGLYTALLVFITYQTPRGVYIKSFTIPYAPAPLYIGNETYVITVNAQINTTAPPSIPISQLKPAGPAVTKPLLELSNNTDQPGQLYDCMSQAPEYTPGSVVSPGGYLALANCTGYNGTIPLLWISWSRNVRNTLSSVSLNIALSISASSSEPFDIYAEELKNSSGQVIADVIGSSFSSSSLQLQMPLKSVGQLGSLPSNIYYVGTPGAYGMAQYQYWYCPDLNLHTGTCVSGYVPTNLYYYYVIGFNLQNNLMYGSDTGNGPVSAIFQFLSYYGLSLPTPEYVGCAVDEQGLYYFYFPNGTSIQNGALISEYVANIFNAPLPQVTSALVSALEGGVIDETIVETGGLPTWAQWLTNVLSDMDQLTNMRQYYTTNTEYYAVSIGFTQNGQYVYYNVVPGVGYVNYNSQTYAVPMPGVELNETWAGGQQIQGCPPT